MWDCTVTKKNISENDQNIIITNKIRRQPHRMRRAFWLRLLNISNFTAKALPIAKIIARSPPPMPHHNADIGNTRIDQTRNRPLQKRAIAYGKHRLGAKDIKRKKPLALSRRENKCFHRNSEMKFEVTNSQPPAFCILTLRAL